MRVLCVKYSEPGLACYRGYVAYEDIIVVTGTGDVALTCPRQNNNDVLSPIKHGYHCTIVPAHWRGYSATEHRIVQQGKLSYHLVQGEATATSSHHQPRNIIIKPPNPDPDTIMLSLIPACPLSSNQTKCDCQDFFITYFSCLSSSLNKSILTSA